MKKLVAILTLIGLVFPTLSFGQNSNDPVVFLEKGLTAPFSGYLFSPKRELGLRLTQIELDYVKQEVVLQNTLIVQLKLSLSYSDQIANKEKERAELWRKQAEDSTLRHTDAQKSQNYYHLIFFGAGIIIPIISAWIIKQTQK